MLGEGAKDRRKAEDIEEQVRQVREGFLLFFVSSLKSCDDFWEKKDGDLRINRDKLIDGTAEDYK